MVIVREEDGWLAFFCTDPAVSAVALLETMADRGAIEQTFKDIKEVWAAGQQQVRNVYASIGAFAVNLTLYSVVEAWAWARSEEELVDRCQSPWDRGVVHHTGAAAGTPPPANYWEGPLTEMLAMTGVAPAADPPDRTVALARTLVIRYTRASTSALITSVKLAGVAVESTMRSSSPSTVKVARRATTRRSFGLYPFALGFALVPNRCW